MLMERAAGVRSDAPLAEQVRDRIAAGVPVQEVALLDMPLWLFREVDHSRQVAAVFVADQAGLVVYTDGGRTLRRNPA